MNPEMMLVVCVGDGYPKYPTVFTYHKFLSEVIAGCRFFFSKKSNFRFPEYYTTKSLVIA